MGYPNPDIFIPASNEPSAVLARVFGECREGQIPCCFAAGYPTVRNKLVIDGDSAAVVRRIFDMTLQGMGSTAIARRLNREGVLTPGAYFRQKNPGSGRFPKASEKNDWTAASVLNILHQYEYTGALVGRKRYKASLHEKRTVPQDKADWIIYEGAHEIKLAYLIQKAGTEYCRKGRNKGLPAH